MNARQSIPLRAMRAVKDLLASAGIPASTPTGTSLAGTLDLHEHKLVLRVDVYGKAILYDPREGTLNLRIPKHTWKVSPKGRGWTQEVVDGVAHYVRTLGAASPAMTAATPAVMASNAVMATHEDADQAVLDLCATGMKQRQIAVTVYGDGDRYSTVRKIVRGWQHRGPLSGGHDDAYKPELDPQRRAMLARRDALGIPDDQMVSDLRVHFARIDAEQGPVEWVLACGPAGPVPDLLVARNGEGQWSNGTPVLVDASRPSRWRGRGRQGGKTGDPNRHLVLLHTFHGPPPGPGYRPGFVSNDHRDFRASNLRWVPPTAPPVAVVDTTTGRQVSTTSWRDVVKAVIDLADKGGQPVPLDSFAVPPTPKQKCVVEHAGRTLYLNVGQREVEPWVATIPWCTLEFGHYHTSNDTRVPEGAHGA